MTCLLAAASGPPPRTVTRIAMPLPDYRPADLLPVAPPASAIQGDAVVGGVFTEGTFTVTGRSSLPWCHMLSNPSFGTMVSDCALGFTFAGNARENKLTPWYNDTRSDNRGELLLLRVGPNTYDLCNGARATFAPGSAVYESEAGPVSARLEVRILPDGGAKLLTLELIQQSEEECNVEIAYYTEPVLGVDRRGAPRLQSRWEDGRLFYAIPSKAASPAPRMHRCRRRRAAR